MKKLILGAAMSALFLADNTLQTIAKLTKRGYKVIAVDNKYLNPQSAYKGIHLDVVSPKGQLFETANPLVGKHGG